MNSNYKISDFVKIKNNRVIYNYTEIFRTESSLNANEFYKAVYNFLHITYPKFHKMDKLCKLGLLATEVLFRNKSISPHTALVLSNSSSSSESDIKHKNLMKEMVSPAVFVYTLPNIVSGEISIKHNLQSENAFFISKNFNPVLLMDYSISLLISGNTPAVVCGWIEGKNDQYDVFLCLISTKGTLDLSVGNLEALYNFDNE